MFDELAGGRVGLFTVWLLGVSMGLTACTVTCLPFLGSWLLGRSGDTREAMLHTWFFLGGRVTTYGLLGALAGWAGSGLGRALGGASGNAIIGGASIVAGLWLLATGQAGRCGVKAGPPATAPLRFRPRGRSTHLPPILLGASLSLTPCTPLASLLTLAAQSTSLGQGAAYGLAFGLGAAVTPILVLAPLAGRLGRALRADRRWLGPWITAGAALVLIALGLRRLLAP